MPRPGRFTPNNKLHILGDAEWATGLAWKDMEKRKIFAPGRFQTPDLPVRSESLYQLR
jgi:hypothetical protein